MARTFSRLPASLAVVFAMLLGVGSTASGETLLMPKRDYLAGTAEVVWGVTTQANGTAFVLDYGDATAQTTGNVVDRSYIAFQHTYALAGTYTVQLCVGAGAAIPGCTGELAQVEVRVFNGATMGAFELRGLNINRAIQDGLRYLWTAQTNRAGNFPAGVMTDWGSGASFGPPYAALTVLAFMNHGYSLPNNNNAPTGLYEKYVVQRGINFVASVLQTVTLSNQPAGNPCVGGLTDPCVGLFHNFDPGYSNAVVALPFAASNALNRNIPAGVGNATYVAGKPMGEVLQRIMNALAFGQNDFNAASNSGRGGWIYQFSNNTLQQSDGSTVGWDILAMLDAAAAGTVIPAFVQTEFTTHALQQGLNNDGSFDYRADNSPTGSNGNVAKAGVGLQGLFWGSTAIGNAKVQAGIDYISDRWNANLVQDGFTCGNATYNKGCAYGMFNVFKAFKLYGVETLPGVTRAAGPGPIPAGDWYADYVDWLVANQTAPNTVAGGNWVPLDFSCCDSDNAAVDAAMAELILAPVALIQPDPETFSEVGLRHGNPLTTDPVSNIVNTQHTFVARAESAGGAGIPGVTISYQVTGRNGANVAATGSGVTNASGEITFQYTDTGPAGSGGSDTIQAFIGNVGSNASSNVLTKNWILAQGARCDTDNDQDVDITDLNAIRAAFGQAANATDPRDGNANGVINIADLRFCQLRLGPIPQ